MVPISFFVIFLYNEIVSYILICVREALRTRPDIGKRAFVSILNGTITISIEIEWMVILMKLLTVLLAVLH